MKSRIAILSTTICLTLLVTPILAQQVPVAVPVSGPVTHIGVPIQADCLVGNTEAPVYAVNNWMTGNEMYKHIFDPSWQGCCATGFRFEAEGRGEAVLMGDEVPAGAPLELHAHCPEAAALSLLRDGECVAECEGRDLEATATEPGVYRIEARLAAQPWIFSNPIYVRRERDE